jgi:hypothetical protein
MVFRKKTNRIQRITRESQIADAPNHTKPKPENHRVVNQQSPLVWSMRRWYRHLVGFGSKASSQFFEGAFQSEIPRMGERGGEGEKESADGPQNDIRAATDTTRCVTKVLR